MICTTNIVHTCRSNGFNTFIYLGRRNSKASTPAKPDRADTISVNKRSCTDKIDRSTKILDKNVRRRNMARFTAAFSIIRLIKSQSYKPSFGKFNSINTCTLFLHPTIRRSYDNCRIFFRLVKVFRHIHICSNRNSETIFISDILNFYLITNDKSLIIFLSTKRIHN